MKRKNPSYKYQCDNKLKIYSESPFNTSQYYRKLNNAKPRYMNEYYKAPKYNSKRDDKNFNGILNKYYNDYNIIKNKYNVIEDEPLEKEYTNYNRLDYNEYENRKNTINYLLFSYDSPEIDENTFDITDALVNEMYNGNEDTLLKNTQINNDYNKRLEEENELDAPSNQPTLSTHSKKINYMNDDKNENKKKYEGDENKKEEEEEKISSNEPKLKNKQNNNDIINEENDNENENENYNENENENDNDNENEQLVTEENKKKEDNEYILKFENNNNNDDDELMMFEDIISNDFRKYYNPPYYKIPDYIKEEIEKENEEKKEKKEEYEKYKDHNIVNKDEDGNIQKLEDIIKEDNNNPQLDQIKDSNDNNPPQNPEKEEEKKEEEKVKEEEEKVKEEEKYLEYDGEFEPVDDEEIKKNTVENIINNNEGEDKEKKEEEKENNGNGKGLKRSVKYREERFESIPVDDLDDEIDYGGFD